MLASPFHDYWGALNAALIADGQKPVIFHEAKGAHVEGWSIEAIVVDFRGKELPEQPVFNPEKE